MGHAHHFLSRLDRVSQGHVELALALYNDPELLRAVLAAVYVPEGAERVAISLDHPTEGPFLLVTRAGHFVTCLGEGMRVQWPVVPRAALDAAMTQVESHRARRARFVETCADEASSRRLVQRLFDAGEHLTREEFVALAALMPVLRRYVSRWISHCAEAMRVAYTVLPRVDFSRPRDRELDALHHWWTALWTFKHLTLLHGHDGAQGGAPTLADGCVALGREAGLYAPFGASVWAAARIAPDRSLDALRHARGETPVAAFDRAAALFALATRSAWHRRLAHGALRAGPVPPVRDVDAHALHPARRAYERAFVETFAADAEQQSLALAIRGAHTLLTQRPETARANGWNSLYDVPVEVAVSLAVDDLAPLPACSAPGSVLGRVPALARLRAEDFYLPAARLQRVRMPWSVERAVAVLHRRAPRIVRAPVVSTERVGRNDPCPCASGQKFKRCCGA